MIAATARSGDARELGFPFEAIRELLSLGGRPEQNCAQADAIAGAHLAEVGRKIRALTALRGELKRMVQSCRCGRISECRVMEVLADHSHAHCASPAHARAKPDERFGA